MSALRQFWKRLLTGLRWILVSWFVLSIGSVLIMRWVDPWTSAFMLRDRTIALFNGDTKYRFSHQWADWNKISGQIKVAVMASEDQTFATHYGFDFVAMKKAWLHNQRGRRIRGGSTISQQVAKNIYLWPSTSYVRKGIEAYFTMLIELCWPKRRILEVYLNSAEFGYGTFGVEAASRRFFNKAASKLTASEAALLAAVLPAPKRYLVNKPSTYVRARQAWILRQMSRIGGISALQTL